MLKKKIEVCELVAYFPMMVLFVLDRASGPLLVEDIEKWLGVYFGECVNIKNDSLKTTLSRMKKSNLIKTTREKKQRLVRGGRKRDLFSIMIEGKKKFELTREFMSVFYVEE